MADGANDEITHYCVCRRVEDSGIMIECIRGTGGCNGWVHPHCCDLILTPDELEAIDSYVCPLCETPADDFTKMKGTLNTKLANKLALKMRQKKKDEMSTSKWSCKTCGWKENDKAVKNCEKCAASRKKLESSKDKKESKERKESSAKATKESKAKSKDKSKDKSKERASSRDKKESKDKQPAKKKSKHSHKDSKSKLGSLDDDPDLVDDDEEAARRRRSGREASKTRKNYRVPNSDDDLSDSLMDEDEIARKRLQNKKKRKRLDENPENAGQHSEDDDEEAEFIASGVVGGSGSQAAVAAVGPTMVIDKIMSSRHRELPAPAVVGSASSLGLTAKPVPEYFIKWKGFSYLHCSWETRETLLAIDMNNKQRIKRFHEKHGHGHLHHQHHHHHKTQEMDAGLNASELEIFNPEYLEVHRILAHRQDPVPYVPDVTETVVDDGRRFLVKWRVLPYTDATWERACDLKDDDAIAKYDARRVVPPKDEWDALPRPTLRDYRKLDKSPLFGVDHSLSLRAYQLEGLNWLMWNYYNERPSILADEMGLGKTIQTLAFLDSMRTNDKIKARGPFLVVAPLSLIAQWQSECETWTTMNCVVYHGNTEARELIREFEFYFLDAQNRPDKKKPFKFNILVTTYEVAIKDISVLSKIKWRCLVVDEAHRLKNQASRLVEQMRSLRRDHCVLLTGTPLQNKTEELWALLNFLDAKSFPSVSDFLDKFGDLHEAQQVVDLHKMLKPYLLRRQKEDVEKSLPPKEETIIEVELTPVQKQWYRAIYERNTSFLSRGGNPNNVPNLMNVMMELRKCCNHPYLNNGVEERLNDGLVNDAQRHEMMVKCCGKMVLIDKLLPRLKDGGHKVLIFSQMVRVLDIIEDYLRYMGYLHERLDGNIRGNDRQAAVDRFVKPEYNRFVMLLSTKAGGLGLNLTAADTVIIFDSDWNPQNDLQAQARAHRIGQTHSVKIYRLITSKTYEMHMFHKASLKLGLDKAVLTHMRREQEHEQELEAAGGGHKPKKASNKAQEAKEIDELLKRGAYDVFRDDDKAGEQFCEADIDQILQRSSQIVQYEQNAQSSFSKASFVSATTSDDVDIDDPDFWKKAVGLTEPDVADEEELPLQRKRTRVSRFGAHGAGAAGAGAGGASGAGGLGSESESEDELDKKDRENDRKERERDEKEKEKADEKKEPRDWTQNGRDRLQRALMHYGFGRWEIIRSQSGGSRTVDEVEQFAREFIYACGLSCAETSGAASSRDDSPFVKAMIRASVYAHKQSLVDEVEMSPVLQDDDFVLKLKQGGGRRVLIRLDMLWRLRRLVAAALDELDQAYWALRPDQEMTSDDDATTTQRPPPPPSASVEFDDRVAYYGVDAVKNKLELAAMGGAERPPWTQITNWWNDEADRSLLIGVFLHGYGRCAQILGDNRLRFQEISEAYDASVEADPNSSHTDAASAVKQPLGAMSEERTTTAETVVAKPEPVAKSETSAEGSGGAAAVSAEGSTTADDKKFKQPEVQAMNRLLFWLLSADDVKRQKELELFKKERASVEQQRQASLERKLRAASLRRVELKAMQLAQLDLLRHCQCVVRNAQQMPEPVIGSKIKPKDWTKEERRTFAYLVALHGAPRIDAKASISIDTPRRRAASGQEHLTVPPFAWETDSLSWMQIVTLGKLNKTTQSAKAFYVDRFLPKCQEIAAMKVDPLGTDQRALALADLVGIEFVDAHEGVLAHGLKARNMAWVTLRRTQLLAAIGDILTHRKSELLELLRSGSPDLVDKMPVWWCPWVHDLGVFYGMARHGVYAWESILLDRQLPFHRRARENHIRQVFLHGTEAFEALYKHRFATEDDANAWLLKVVDEFPSLALLEQKVHAICVLLNGSGPKVGNDGGAAFDLSRLEEFTFPPPGNAFECEIMARVRTQDVVLANPFVELTSASVAQELASIVEASKERRDAYLRHLMGGTNNGHNGHNDHNGDDVEMQEDGGQQLPAPPQPPVPQEPKPRHSQIPIHMLVS